MSPRLTQELTASALRDIGQLRTSNQDNVFTLTTVLPRGNGERLSVGLFAVADGMGGHDDGEMASYLAIQSAVRFLFSHFLLPTLDDNLMDDIQSLMRAALEEANRVIWEYATQHDSDMGTTCSIALLMEKILFIAHVGDTRIYLVEGDHIRLLTTDHSAVGRLIELGHLPPSAARDNPLRNQLYRTIGQQQNITVDFGYYPVGESSHLLLCSDGLWGCLSEEEILSSIHHFPCPHQICRELIDTANNNGGDDNISAIVVTLPREVNYETRELEPLFFEGEPDEEDREAEEAEEAKEGGEEDDRSEQAVQETAQETAQETVQETVQGDQDDVRDPKESSHPPPG